MPKGGTPMAPGRRPDGIGGATAGAGAAMCPFLPFFFCRASRDWRWACNNFCILAICSFMAAVWALVFFVVEGGGFCELVCRRRPWFTRALCAVVGTYNDWGTAGCTAAAGRWGALAGVFFGCLAALARNGAQGFDY